MLNRSSAAAKALRACSAAAGLVLASLPLANVAKGDEPKDQTEAFAIVRGGQYYDKWWAVIDADAPKNTHPAYPAKGKKKGANTWRCKECHGWDYKGKDGAYAKGSHFTGIKGISGMTKANTAEIAKILRGKLHGYTKKMMSDRAVEQLAAFVRAGQFDMDAYIDRKTKKVKGDKAHGAAIYQTVCANCHGFDGKMINFKSEEKPEYIGTVSKDNPWETLHKVRHGQPGQVMPALVTLKGQDLADIVAYAQTLPTK